jgi:hypothetical protein
MARVLLLVEGQTEEAVVNHLRRPHLIPLGVFVEKPSLSRTKELPEGKPYKCGVTTYRQRVRVRSPSIEGLGGVRNDLD